MFDLHNIHSKKDPQPKMYEKNEVLEFGDAIRNVSFINTLLVVDSALVFASRVCDGIFFLLCM